MQKLIVFLWVITVLVTIALLSFQPMSGQALPPEFPTMSSTSGAIAPTMHPFTPTPQPTMTPTPRPTIVVTLRPDPWPSDVPSKGCAALIAGCVVYVPAVMR